jgi:prepilin-type N-terminal cleavage/methylation domain-containing protein
MNPCKVATHPSDCRTVRGMTLPELMVATAVGSLILMVMATLFISSARGFAAIGSYVNMDAASRNALDHMTLEIRQTGALTVFSSTRLTFTAPGQTNSFLVYNWDSAARQLTEWKTGNTTTNTLLNGCDQLTFSLYNAAFAPTTNVSATKGLSVKWKCSRTILGLQSTTEDMQQALIIIRNKPAS